MKIWKDNNLPGVARCSPNRYDTRRNPSRYWVIFKLMKYQYRFLEPINVNQRAKVFRHDKRANTHNKVEGLMRCSGSVEQCLCKSVLWARPASIWPTTTSRSCCNWAASWQKPKRDQFRSPGENFFRCRLWIAGDCRRGTRAQLFPVLSRYFLSHPAL